MNKETLKHITIEKVESNVPKAKEYKVTHNETGEVWHMNKFDDGSIGGGTPERLENSKAEDEAINWMLIHN